MDKNKICKHFSFFLLTGILITFLTGCITPFEPEINESAICLNIDGSIIKGEEEQRIVISKSTSLKEKEFEPVYGCTVYVIDNLGNKFDFSGKGPGLYVANIEDAFLETNKSFQLHVIDFLGEKYESDFETIYENQPVDSVTKISEKNFSPELGSETEGFQFYIDLNESENASKFYRWTIDETWEHHAKYFLDLLYDPDEGSLTSIGIRDSLFYCYDHNTIRGLYLSTTLYMQKNKKKKIPLHYICIPSIKLSVKYSCMINQYSLGEDAYNYWDQKRVDLMESGGMYTKQPSHVISNIRNINDPDELVLGFFWASEKKQKRFFFKGSPSYYIDNCELKKIDFESVYGSTYLVLDGELSEDESSYTTYGASPNCFDCRKQGGTTVVPEYWNDY